MPREKPETGSSARDSSARIGERLRHAGVDIGHALQAGEEGRFSRAVSSG